MIYFKENYNFQSVGGVGVQLFPGRGLNETHRTCDFPEGGGEGGVRNHYPPALDPHMDSAVKIYFYAP